MSTEQDTRRVSETYRDIATETSPANLDDKVMAMARQEARTRYGLARAWIRPVAWAATIGLSFAFILEMTYFSDDAPPIDTVMPASTENDADTGAEPASQAPALKRAPAALVTAPEIKASAAPTLAILAALLIVAAVLELRDQGLADAAGAEFDALREAFPDFREPVSE